MRQDAEWMCQLDERILEHLDDDTWSTARLLSQHFRSTCSVNRIESRCVALADAGLVAPVRDGSSMFEITTIGRLYLKGEIDADLRQPTPAPRPPHAVRPGWYAGFG
jgi:hypothetical protein